MTIPWLSLLMFVPLVLGTAVVLWPRSGAGMVRSLALGSHVLVLVVLAGMAASFDVSAGGLQFVERRAWVPSLGVEYHLGLDGLGLVSVLLAASIPAFAALVSDRVAEGREPLYYGLLLLLEAGLMGTFTALNFFHWFLFWELSLVPAYLLVRLFGGPGAGPASFQFFVYTMVGSVALLLGFVALRLAGGTFDLIELARLGRTGGLASGLAERLPSLGMGLTGATLERVVFVAVLLGFAVKVPIWPFHTWLPSTYTEAPSPVTMVLTGVMSKMGMYGLLRIALPIFPAPFGDMQGVLLVLALCSVVMPAWSAFAQRDMKRVLAYSSINHLGYCLMGAFALAPGAAGEAWVASAAAPALNGVLLQMLNHGVTAATLFAGVELFERRTGGVRRLDQFGGLRRVAPVFCGLMGISVFASLGLPGLNGFVGEFLIFRGVYAAAPWVAVVGSFGLLATAVFLLTLMLRVFHGDLDRSWAGFRDLETGERWMLGVPVALMFVLGVYPDCVLRWTNATVLGLVTGN
ncbi:MAG: NADH-quinone oxidoreductase subunit M [Verrucomicrobiales bacterium]|nr:NADH-quinone oxidoreductase subunit M [Verrucomicrobiales bacterium]